MQSDLYLVILPHGTARKPRTPLCIWRLTLLRRPFAYRQHVSLCYTACECGARVWRLYMGHLAREAEELNVMELEAVLSTARSGNLPSGWHVWPLRRDRVMRSIIGWAILTIIGFVLLVPAVVMTVPQNFERSFFAFVATGALLIILAAMAFGSLWIMVADIQRVLHADDYLLVMTPDDYVMAKPKKVTHVPMVNVGYVTLKGIRIPEADLGAGMEPFGRFGARQASAALLFGGGMMRRKPKESPSLAFLDLRTETEVVVGTDDSFDNLLALDGILRSYAGEKERTQAG